MQGEPVPTSAINASSILGPQRVVDSDVKAGLVPGESPLDFIKKNLNTAEAIEVPKPAEAVATPAPKEDTALLFKERVQEPPKPVVEEKDPEPFAAEPAKEVPIETAPTEEEIPELQDAPELTLEDNFKRLKTKYKLTAKEKKELEAKIENAQKEVEKYKTGEALPELVAEKEKEIQRLSPYEKLFNLKSSKEYKEKFIKPVEETKEQLKNIFKDYNIPEELIDRAVNTESRAELNRFLTENFDDVGALEVKALVTKIKDLGAESRAAESKPAEVLEQLTRESQAFSEQQKLVKTVHIQSEAKDGWTEALMGIRDEGKILELIRKPNDPAFNEKHVDPRLRLAAQDFTKLVNELTENGLEKLPKSLAKVLATGILKAHAATSAVLTRDGLLNHVEELEVNHRRSTMINRPPIGGGHGSTGSGGAPAAETTAQEDGRSLIGGVLAKRGR